LTPKKVRSDGGHGLRRKVTPVVELLIETGADFQTPPRSDSRRCFRQREGRLKSFVYWKAGADVNEGTEPKNPRQNRKERAH
jgi:hypothetical protein